MNTKDRRETIISTISGRIFHPFDPREDEIYMPDAAHSLSNKIRWNGHILYRYTIAQHSIEVMNYIQDHGGTPIEQFVGLLHDVSEAYLVDMPTPIKAWMIDFIETEDKIWECLANKYSLPIVFPNIVNEADSYQLYREGCQLFPEVPEWIQNRFTKEEIGLFIADTMPEIQGYQDAYSSFMREFDRLYIITQSG